MELGLALSTLIISIALGIDDAEGSGLHLRNFGDWRLWLSGAGIVFGVIALLMTQGVLGG